MRGLEKKLESWVSSGLISREQAHGISNYEANQSGFWGVSTLIMLGASVIGIGIISLVAANWADIPGIVKLVGDFIILGGLAYFIYEAKNNNNQNRFELLLILLMFACLASIGLISQVYHTGGKLYQALLFWTVITSGLAASSKKPFAAHLWVAIFMSSLALVIVDSKLFTGFFQKNVHAIVLAMTLLCGSLTIFSKTMTQESHFTKAFRRIFFFAGVLSVFFAEAGGLISSLIKANMGLQGYVPSYIFSGIILLGIWLNPDYRKSQKNFLTVSLVLLLSSYHLNFLGIESDLVYAAFTIATLGVFALFLASIHEQKIFQIIILLIGLRFLGLYFQALGGLALTGLGLVVSGVVIVASAIMWNKHRKKIMDTIEGWAK